MNDGLQIEPARTSPLRKERLSAQLEKTGETPFRITSLTLDYNDTFFAPVREINGLRRAFFTLAEKKLVAAYLPLPDKVIAAKERLNKYRQPAIITRPLNHLAGHSKLSCTWIRLNRLKQVPVPGQR